jgi:hypothetical protein
VIPIPPALMGLGVRIAAVGVVVAVALLYHFHAVSAARADGRKAGEDAIQVKWDADRLKMIAAHDAELADHLSESARRIKEQAEIADEERAKRLAAESDRDELVGELAKHADHDASFNRRLRDAIATHDLATRARIGDTAAAGECAPAIEAADLQGRLLQGLDGATAEARRELGDAAATVAGFAEQAAGNGSECARRYDALIKPKVAAAGVSP